MVVAPQESIMLRATCPQCKKPVHIEETLLGTIVSCPGCGQQMRLPPKPVPAEPSVLESNVHSALASPGASMSAASPDDTGWEMPGLEPEVTELVTDEPLPRPVLPHFTTAVYRPDNGFSPAGAAILVSKLAVTAVLLGYLTSLVSQWFYLIIIFPFVLGAVLGAVGRVGIRFGKVRNPWLAGGAGFLAGALTMTSVQYFDYLRFDRAFPAPMREAVLRQLDPAAAGKMNALVLVGAKRSILLQAARVHDFPSYIDFAARRGVTISHGVGGNGGTNLGYVGTYIYWLVEMLIAAGIAFTIMRAQAHEPFCTSCKNWKQKRAIGTLSAPAGPVVEAMRDGDLNALYDHDPRPSGGPLTVTLFTCPQCAQEGTAEILVQHITRNKKGQEQRRPVLCISYPAEATGALDTLFAR